MPGAALRNTKMKTTTTENRRNELNELGFTLKILHGPIGGVDKHDQSDWPHIAYKVMLEFNGREVITTDYKLGVGHVDPKRAFIGSVVSRPMLATDEQSMLLTWQSKPGAAFKDKQLQANVAAKLAKSQKVVPELGDVLHSLILDGEAFFNAQSFEDWAGEFGYDADSRKAEAIYRVCDSTGRKLAANVPKDVLEKVREITREM